MPRIAEHDVGAGAGLRGLRDDALHLGRVANVGDRPLCTQFISGLTSDGRMLSIVARISAFDIDDGSLGEHRMWGQMPPTPALTMLAEALRRSSSRPTRARSTPAVAWGRRTQCTGAARASPPGGAILEEVPAPDDLVFYRVMLGGEEGRTPLICAAPDWQRERADPETRSIRFTTRVEVPHSGLP